MSTFRLLTASLVLAATAACSSSYREQAGEITPADATGNTRWDATIGPQGSPDGEAQLSGSASLAPSADGTGTIATLELANASPGGVHPWEVRRGKCGNGGGRGPWGAGGSYQFLRVDEDGNANGEANLRSATPNSGNYFVVVLASETDRSTVVACGDLAHTTSQTR